MAGNAAKPLTTEQAKARLREAAQHASAAAWFQQHPWTALGIAAASGFMMSRLRWSASGSMMITKWLGPLLMGSALRQLKRTTPAPSTAPADK